MKRLIIIIFALAFLSFSCSTIKTNNIHTRHGKENDQYKIPANDRYKTTKNGGKTMKR